MTLPSSERNPSRVWKSQDERPLPPPPFLRQIFTDMWEGMFALLIWTVALWVMTIGLAIRARHLVRRRDERDVSDGAAGHAEPDRN